MTSYLNIHFFVEGQSLGSGKISAVPRDHHQDHQSKGFAFNCPHCGKQWASCPISNEGHPGQWHFINAICSAHPAVIYTVPGSLWKPGYSDLIESFSPQVLQRELLLHLNFLDKQGDEHVIY